MEDLWRGCVGNERQGISNGGKSESRKEWTDNFVEGLSRWTELLI